MKARILKSTGSWYKIETEEGRIAEARARGNLRLEGFKSTNPIAVGDWVDYSEEGESGNCLITRIHERKNYIVRKSINLSKQIHVLAANVDYMLLFVTPGNPRTPYGFIDRILATAEAYHIESLLIFNKLDCWTDDEMELAAEMMAVYEPAGYTCFAVNSTKRSTLQPVLDKMANSVCMLIGHSGTGKSTFVKTINPELDIKVAELSQVHKKGRHTTTFAEMHHLTKNTWVIDTPGLREFGVARMKKAELSHFFPEMRALLNTCKFNNCIHVNEPGCRILQEVENGNIAETRYRSYLSMLESEAE
jgi:ribosome biogenesis GTPase / thiamine phosphate phosphatase